MSAALAVQWNWSLDGWIIATGVVCAMACAVLGNFLLLKRMSMMGDAISHSVLPGIAVAFLVAGTRNEWIMFAGAVAAGVATALLVQWLHRSGGVEEGAAMGVTLTALFAVGLVILVRAAREVHLDADCVLYGNLEFVPLDTLSLGPVAVPRVFVSLAVVFVLDLLFVLLFYKELKVASFDPQLATAVGINANLMHYLLLAMVAMTTVASFEAVGSILVLAMLIVPPATANLLTDRLGIMIGLSLVAAAVAAGAGHAGAVALPPLIGFPATNTAGMMAVASGALFAVALVAAPRHGLVAQGYRRAALTLRVAGEDILGLLFRLEEMAGDRGGALNARSFREALDAGPLLVALACARLRRQGHLARREQGYALTDAGREVGRTIIRSHRLWETFLVEKLRLATDHVHGTATRLEHVTDPGLRRALEASVGEPERDPQGKRIP